MSTSRRHFEDAGRIVRSLSRLPALSGYSTVRALADEMLAAKQIVALPAATHTAFTPTTSDRWQAVRKAWEAIGPMFWGPRISLDEACADVGAWLHGELGG